MCVGMVRPREMWSEKIYENYCQSHLPTNIKYKFYIFVSYSVDYLYLLIEWFRIAFFD